MSQIFDKNKRAHIVSMIPGAPFQTMSDVKAYIAALEEVAKAAVVFWKSQPGNLTPLAELPPAEHDFMMALDTVDWMREE